KPSSAIAASTRALVAADTGRVPLRAYDTVLSETFASRATSCMVAIRVSFVTIPAHRSASTKRFDGESAPAARGLSRDSGQSGGLLGADEHGRAPVRRALRAVQSAAEIQRPARITRS